MFSGSGTVDGEVLAVLGSTINVTGTLTMGDPAAVDGFIADAQLNVGANQVFLRSKGFVNLGQLTTLAGGSINGNRIALDVGDNIEGFGSVTAAFFARGGSLIKATGNLNLGFVNFLDGYFSDGVLLVNEHTVTLHDANDAVVGSLTSLGDGVNPGTLVANNGLTVEFGKNITGFGTVNTPNDPFKPLTNNGHIAGNSALQPITLAGYVKGVGTLDHVIITGTDAPGFSPATVYRGSVTYAGTLDIELGGTSVGDFDRIIHSGAATFGGVLNVSLINGFAPDSGDSFDLFDWDLLAGGFSSLNLPTLGGTLDWDTSNLLVDGTLSVVSTSLEGDLNGDGFVGIADLNLVLGNWNQTVPPGDPLADPSGDNFVGIEDLNAVLGNWNAGAPPIENATIPEPTSAALLALMGVYLFRRDLTK